MNNAHISFIRDAVIQISGNLTPERALAATREYLSGHLPADRIHLEVVEPGEEAIRAVAVATATGCRILDQTTPLTVEWRELLARDEVIFVNRPDGDAPVSAMLRFHGLDEHTTSVLLMPISSKRGLTGLVVFNAEGLDQYTEEHLRLLTLLRGPMAVFMENALRHGELVRRAERLTGEVRHLRQTSFSFTKDEIIGMDTGLRNVLHQGRQATSSEDPVLLVGESGTGKELIARALHHDSARRDGPFVALNCCAIPRSRHESELFGHEKGAFPGATERHRGCFERAHQGTIVLDGIDRLPLNTQVRLHSVLQDREIERVGSARRIPVDFRLIATTNRDLESLERIGRFRRDLRLLLQGSAIPVPPLRERKEDIPSLVQHFIRRLTGELKLQVVPKHAPGALDALRDHDWPGNVRELKNLVERAMIHRTSDTLQFDTGTGGIGTRMDPTTGRENDYLAEVEPGPRHVTSVLDQALADHIRTALSRTGGKIHGPGGAGELLGINPNTLRSRMRKLGIPFGRKARDLRRR